MISEQGQYLMGYVSVIAYITQQLTTSSRSARPLCLDLTAGFSMQGFQLDRGNTLVVTSVYARVQRDEG